MIGESILSFNKSFVQVHQFMLTFASQSLLKVLQILYPNFQ